MLTSLQNPLVKQMRKLHRTKERQRQNLLLLEGTNLLESCCGLSYPLVTVCCTPEWQSHYPQLWKKASQGSERAEVITHSVMEAVTTTVNPDGVVAVASRDALRQSLATKPSLGLAVEKLQDPGNLGTIIRTAVAAHSDGLWLSADSVDVDHPKVLRASAGEWFRLPMAVSPNLKSVVEGYREQGIQVVATLPQAAFTYWEIDFRLPTVILLGNEAGGLSADLVALADQQVTIPLSAGVESLNVAIASALLLYEAQRQRQDWGEAETRERGEN
ncbi:MAG: rRNA methyltransferase [Cyanobacteria bacterium QH_1_48_107]|jgi:TrmH family RNA methyltransferase|nr:MAG: rRNA methyltransferase [Cyanobacteria bacterium QH_1_48_107]PSO56134.1 MAG: rRNA methyltransferase [Cyanobacteria bacterium QH_10_48_56]PSO61170.1 MAG: rRNA methyltransferase [Cyanobacteria bacterium QH_7_48_89]PSO68550.1 MAG: rRNA methyltransferase [Cyanobacteria bacterium QS_1_48_34]PSO92575.1 MAG: rRNA methyltransferase [Cyanobacteria bacterium SW_6_48_11]PSP33959.1 MAG: rRNA methyltransferase [Cyanobacteria bacterium QS_8_48_54]